MLKVLKNTAVLFLKKSDIFILFIVPLFLINISPLSPTAKIVLKTPVYCLTSLGIYLYLLYDKPIQLFSVRLVFSYFLTDFGITMAYYFFVLIVLMMPLSIVLHLLIIYFFGLYFLCRFSIIPALIVNQNRLSLHNILLLSQNSYLQWMTAATILYLPFLFIEILVPEGIAYSFITSLQSPLLCCFYVCYLKKR